MAFNAVHVLFSSLVFEYLFSITATVVPHSWQMMSWVPSSFVLIPKSPTVGLLRSAFHRDW